MQLTWKNKWSFLCFVLSRYSSLTKFELCILKRAALLSVVHYEWIVPWNIRLFKEIAFLAMFVTISSKMNSQNYRNTHSCSPTIMAHIKKIATRLMRKRKEIIINLHSPNYSRLHTTKIKCMGQYEIVLRFIQKQKHTAECLWRKGRIFFAARRKYSR